MDRPIPEEHSRTAALITEAGMARLTAARVAVFGIGGVGGHLAEALARAGVGHLLLVDRDTVSLANVNRQAVALRSTLGLPKVEVMAQRIRDINPACTVDAKVAFYLPDTADGFDLDIHIFTTTRELVERIHARGMKVNVWTCDWPDRAADLVAWGVDYITSNILE